MITVVYAHVVRNLKLEFWEELRNCRVGHLDMWVICGNFNSIRKKSEKSRHNFDLRLSSKFNDFVNDFHLIDLKLSNRKSLGLMTLTKLCYMGS